MTRVATSFLSLLLALCLMMAAAAGGSLRTAHALSQAGQMSIIICGNNGVEEITLDRNGNPVTPAPAGECDHCADCSLVPLAALPAVTAGAVPATARALPQVVAPVLLKWAQRVEHPSRGPPSHSKV
ncbi:DUF2946 family protein [Actibacterium sp. XHP0104]|uniref:DUF2946 family protein n=1 Tax=Actibacterium sp. XHP0104 TaxID=2984335 RepID=UPI0021E981CC|nr:DUF2946 family protein [Actibacterium sp. XHP0104]MCV2881257.1 DUF2946 family protein [Actibacterium sp. XHP0104]